MLIVDTNIWLAAADRRADLFAVCVALLGSHRGELAAPAPVIAETSWLILDRLGTDAHHEFLGLIESGLLEPIDLTPSDWSRIRSLCAQYGDLRLDVMDASIVAVAERLELTTIATINHRDFRVIRPRHCHAFELLPS
jgi:uncharacterized protein